MLDALWAVAEADGYGRRVVDPWVPVPTATLLVDPEDGEALSWPKPGYADPRFGHLMRQWAVTHELTSVGMKRFDELLPAYALVRRRDDL